MIPKEPITIAISPKEGIKKIKINKKLLC